MGLQFRLRVQGSGFAFPPLPPSRASGSGFRVEGSVYGFPLTPAVCGVLRVNSQGFGGDSMGGGGVERVYRVLSGL